MYTNRYLSHHGILGQKWGVRRYQNPDGSLTRAGRKRLGRDMEKDANEMTEKHYKEVNKLEYELNEKATNYADKHGIDYDDIDIDNMDEFLTEAGRQKELNRLLKLGIPKDEAEHSIEYNRLLREAEVKTEKFAKEGYQRINKEIMKKYGGYTLEDIKFLKIGYDSKNGVLKGEEKTRYLLRNIGILSVIGIGAGVAGYLHSKRN